MKTSGPGLASRLPRLSREEVQASNLACAAGGTIECAVLDQRIRLSVEGADRGAAPGSWWRFAWPLAGAQLEVALDGVEALLPGLGTEAFDGDDVQRLALVDTVVSSLWLRLGFDALVLRRPVACAAAQAGPSLALGILNLDTGARSRVRVGLPGQAGACATWAAAWQRAARANPPADARPPRQLSLPLACRLGTSLLPLAQAMRLIAGDVVVLGRLPSSGGEWLGEILVGLERMPCARGVVEGDRIVVKDVNVQATNSSSTLSSLDRVHVALSFEIGRGAVPLAEVLRLAPGYVFELGTHPEGEVIDIVVQQARVGRGQLVLVGDTLGVRITSFDLDGAADELAVRPATTDTVPTGAA